MPGISDKPADQLILMANALSRAAPVAWGDFMSALASYSQTIKDECVQSPLETLPVAQGRAQQSERLLAALRECQANAALIATRLKK